MDRRTALDQPPFDSGQLATFEQIAVVRSLAGLGDFLCLVPALRSLRAALPHAKITLVGLAKTQALVQRFHHYIDNLMPFPGYPGLPEQVPQLHQLPAFFAEAQSQCFDLALQMHGSGTITNPLVMMMGAKYNAGFFLPGQYCPEPDRFLPYPSDESEVRCYLQLVAYLGFPHQGEALEFPLEEADHQALKGIEATQTLRSGQYICIHPGASMVDRRWAPDHFANVADALAQRGFQIVLTGSSEEVLLTQAVASLMQMPSLNLAGCTNLGALAALLNGACLLVCNDTGVSHLAAALQVPSVVLFTASNPRRWAPLNRTLHRVVCTARGMALENVIDQAEMLLERSVASYNPLSIALQPVGKGDVPA
jgi:ADP-heptose:LPS heptosyltransferase